MPELAPIMQTTNGLGSLLLAGVVAGARVLCRVAVMVFIVSNVYGLFVKLKRLSKYRMRQIGYIR